MDADKKSLSLLRLWVNKERGQACKTAQDAWSNTLRLASILRTINLKTVWWILQSQILHNSIWMKAVRDDRKGEKESGLTAKTYWIMYIRTRVNLAMCRFQSSCGCYNIIFSRYNLLCFQRDAISFNGLFTALYRHLCLVEIGFWKRVSIYWEWGCHSQFIVWIVSIFEFDHKYNKELQRFSRNLRRVT